MPSFGCSETGSALLSCLPRWCSASGIARGYVSVTTLVLFREERGSRLAARVSKTFSTFSLDLAPCSWKVVSWPESVKKRRLKEAVQKTDSRLMLSNLLPLYNQDAF
jgi:hypothetical protein